MKEKFDFIKFVNQQHTFSQKTFGPGQRVEGVLNHIGKEIKEVEKKPNDVSEWCDIVILAIDGALRQGFSAQEIAQALQAKLEKNMGRQWPDWRTLPEDSPIEHVKTKVKVSKSIKEFIQYMGGDSEGGYELLGIKYERPKDWINDELVEVGEAQFLVYNTDYPEEGSIPIGQAPIDAAPEDIEIIEEDSEFYWTLKEPA